MRRQWAVIGVAVVILILAGSIWLTRQGSPPVSPPAAAPQAGLATPAPVQPAAVPATAPAVPRKVEAARAFEFRHVIIDSSGDAPAACLRFSHPLDPRAEAHYADYLKVTPPVALALRTANTDLCLGNLAYGTDYKIAIAAGLPAGNGDRIAAAETVDISFGDRPALVALSGEGYLLPRGVSNGIAVQTVNVDRVKIRVLRMSDRLLPSQLGDSGFYGQTRALAGEQISRYQVRTLLKDSATLVWSGEMTIEPDHNRTVQTAFPLADVVKPDRPGAYLVIAENAASATPEKFFAAGNEEVERDYTFSYGKVPAHWVISTDIALTALTGADGLHVFARSLASAEPLAGIKLTLLSVGQDRLAEGVTDDRGEADFAPGLLRGRGASGAGTIIAYGAAGDFVLLDITRAAFDLSDRGVAGRPAAGAAEAFLYTERGIYRPGETVEVMALLRDRLGDALESQPLTLVLRRPDGLEAKRFTVAAEPQAGFHQPMALSRSAARGVWSVEALVDPAGQPIGRAQFEVQDFVPQTLKVTLAAEAPVLRPGGPIAARLEGQFLYGAPAAGLKGEAELRIVRDPNPVAEAKGYRFGLVDEKVEDAVQPIDLPAADETGHAALADMLKPLAVKTVPLKGILSAGLFEPSGRIVRDEIELPIRTQPILIGIKPRFANDRAEERQSAVFDIRVFDEAGHAVARPGLHWSLVRENRIYDWFEGNGSWRWHYHTVDEPVASGKLDVGGGAPEVLSLPVEWGDYRLVIDDPASEAATSLRFYAGWAKTSESADTPDKVEVTVEKPAYAPGDTVRLRVKGPFAGKAQLTMAGDRVFETRAVEVPKDGATVEVKAAAEWGAGAYAILSLYRPLTTGRARDPVRAVGLAWIGIDAAPRTLSVALAAPDKIQPRQKVEIPVKITGAKAGEPTRLTLAAVDEGILQLTRFQSPDPVAFFYGKRRLGIDIRDDYGKLLDGSADPGAVHEGGDNSAESVGGQGLAVTATKAVALFSGPVEIGADGTARVTLDIPDFEGQLRLMAVAYGHGAVGHGEAQLIVRDPVIADLSLPRFLAPGDTARLAVLMHNTDGAAGDYHLRLAAEGAARLRADHVLDFALAAGERKQDGVIIEGLDEGVSTIRADLSGPGGYQVHREWQIAVRSPHYPITIEQTAAQAPGKSFRVGAAELKAMLPGSVTVSVSYSGFAGIDPPSLLQSLYRYPYGCTEQLSSSAFPLIYFNDPGLLGALPKDQKVTERVQQAIDTILDRQDADGEFGLWRAGDGEASTWLNVYALDFLLHARDAHFAVPEAALRRSYNWLQQALHHIDTDNSGYYAEAAEATRAYAYYVLARVGRIDGGALRYAHDTLNGLGAQRISYWHGASGNAEQLAAPLSLGQLAGALSLMGDHARARDAFDRAAANLTLGDQPIWWYYHTYYTEIRDLAGLIAIAAETGDTARVGPLVERLKNRSLSAERLTTQEKAWLLAAAHALNKTDKPLALAVNGQLLGDLKLPVALSPKTADIEAGYTIENRGDRELWRTVVFRGAPKVAPSAVATGYNIKKAYFGLDGKPVDPTHLRQNDRLIVVLSGNAEDEQSHRTALVDMLPAGWEIEAPILRNTEYSFLGELSKVRIREARDDRFVAAFDLGLDLQHRVYEEQNDNQANDDKLDPSEFRLAYVVRVVTPGHFILPAAVVEDMYRPGVMARTGAGETTADPR